MRGITMESIERKLGFDPVEELTTPYDPSNEDPYKIDDATPSKWAVLDNEEKEWLFVKLTELGVFPKVTV